MLQPVTADELALNMSQMMPLSVDNEALPQTGKLFSYFS